MTPEELRERAQKLDRSFIVGFAAAVAAVAREYGSPNNMEPYMERVITEKAELDDKISKLENFIFRSGGKWFDVHDAERLRMVKQYCHMRDYSTILGERIANFKS